LKVLEVGYTHYCCGRAIAGLETTSAAAAAASVATSETSSAASVTSTTSTAERHIDSEW
jgi:hypothetical protein